MNENDRIVKRCVGIFSVRELDKFSNSLTSHEIVHSDGTLLVIRF